MPKPTNLKSLLIKHEGLRLKPYTDTVGKLTIGVGRNLADRGISEAEAELMLYNDITSARCEAQSIKGFGEANQARQDVITSLIFNMGLSRLQGFKNMLVAFAAKDYAKASAEMLNSKWATQVGVRATELARMMETGVYEGA